MTTDRIKEPVEWASEALRQAAGQWTGFSFRFGGQAIAYDSDFIVRVDGKASAWWRARDGKVQTRGPGAGEAYVDGGQRVQELYQAALARLIVT